MVPSWFKETLDKRLFKAPHEYAVETAKQKALEVARRMPFVSYTPFYIMIYKSFWLKNNIFMMRYVLI